MVFKYSDKITREKMPKMAKTRAVRYRYPWADLEVGEGFEFAPHIKIMSARVMCTNNGRELGRVFRCYLGVNQKLYALRVDGMHTETPRGPDPEAPRVRAENAPEASEVFGNFGRMDGKEMPDNQTNMVNPPPPSAKSPADWLPPRVKSESELKAEQINREAGAEDEEI